MSEIRSYRSVFDLERRIYRVDRVRLNPGGIPVRGVIYCLAIVVAVTVAGRLPLAADVVDVVPWYIREVVLPALGAGILSLIRIEGRPFHLAARALLGYAVGSRWLCALRPCAAPGKRWLPNELLVLPDGSGTRLRRLRYSGPGTVRQPTSGQVLVLEHGARLDVG